MWDPYIQNIFSNVEEYEDFSTTSCKKAVLVDDHETLSDRQARKFLRTHHLAFVDKVKKNNG